MRLILCNRSAKSLNPNCVRWLSFFGSGMNEVSLDSIEKILKKYLNKKWQSVFGQLAIQLAVVCNNYKTGFLWDIGPTVQVPAVQQIVKEINLKYIRIITIGSDICIINLNKFLLKSIDETIFVDVSHHLKLPAIVHDNDSKLMIKTMILNVKKQCECSYDENVVLDIVVASNVCVPTLFGLFAGYPIVYWYNPLDSIDDNCLENVSLKIFQLTIRNFLIYSVSCPDHLLLANNAFLMKQVVAWFDAISNDMKTNGFTKIDFRVIEKTMSNVIL